MDPRDLFRGIFGFDKGRFDGAEGNRNDRFGDDGDDFDDGSDIDDMFHHFHDDMQKQMEHLNQQMEEMFRQFGATEFSSVLPGPPSLPSTPKNPRDSMLKPPEDKKPAEITPSLPHIKPHPRGTDEPSGSLFGRLFTIPRFETVQLYEKVDKDLDSEIDGKDLSKILVKPDSNERRILGPTNPGIQSRHKSVSVTTIRGADGKMEQRRTVRDSAGNEEMTVTRQVGDKTHTVQTKKDEQGLVEEKESFQNMDKGDLSTFNSDWQGKGRQLQDPRDIMVIPERRVEENSSIFRRLFGFDFSGKDK